jgi:hypothetical protein
MKKGAGDSAERSEFGSGHKKTPSFNGGGI